MKEVNAQVDLDRTVAKIIDIFEHNNVIISYHK